MCTQLLMFYMYIICNMIVMEDDRNTQRLYGELLPDKMTITKTSVTCKRDMGRHLAFTIQNFIYLTNVNNINNCNINMSAYNLRRFPNDSCIFVYIELNM